MKQQGDVMLCSVLHVVCNCVICKVDCGAHMGKMNVLSKKAGNEFHWDVGHVSTKFWTRGYTMFMVPTVFVININFNVTSLPGNK